MVAAYTPERAAGLFGKSPEYFRQLIDEGLLKAFRPGARELNIPMDELIRLAREWQLPAVLAYLERDAFERGLPITRLPTCLLVSPNIEGLKAFEGAGLDAGHANSFARARELLCGRLFYAVVADQACGTEGVLETAQDLPERYPGIVLACLANEDEAPERIQAAGYSLVWRKPVDLGLVARAVKQAIYRRPARRGGKRPKVRADDARGGDHCSPRFRARG